MQLNSRCQSALTCRLKVLKPDALPEVRTQDCAVTVSYNVTTELSHTLSGSYTLPLIYTLRYAV